MSRGLFNLLLVVIAAGTAGAFILSLTGSDPLLVFLGGFALLPFLLLLWVLAALPWTPIRPRTRIIAMLLPILLASIVLGNWPFHLSFRVHRSGLETLASRIRNGEDVEDRPRVGLLRFEQARITDDGTVGLQLTGGPGGGVYLVRQASGSGWVWFNTNWETDLGDGWYLVYQD